MSGSIFRFRVISALIFPIQASDVAASPYFNDSSVMKDTQMRSGSRETEIVMILIQIHGNQ
ncbi:hypothetical protein EPW57_25545 [Salmonella enterica]|nr:hypothetical protein [Salmonella enterica]